MQFKGKHIDPYESFYWNESEAFHRGQYGGGISRTVKTDDSLAIMEEVKIAAMRGRNPDNPSERGKSNGNYQQRLEVNENGTSNTITSVQKDNLVIEPQDTATTICLNSKVDGKQPSVADRVYSSDGCAVAITTGWLQKVAEPIVQQIGNIVDDTNIGFKNPQRGRVDSAAGLSPCLNCCAGGGLEPKIQTHYRIRKLTPRECFRLMDVDENVIDTIQAAGISNSQQYKLAGNSIVVACLEKIFEQMFFPQYTNSRTLFG